MLPCDLDSGIVTVRPDDPPHMERFLEALGYVAHIAPAFVIQEKELRIPLYLSCDGVAPSLLDLIKLLKGHSYGESLEITNSEIVIL